MELREILSQLEERKAAIERAIAALSGNEKTGRHKQRGKARKKMSAAARERIAAAQRKRWKAIRAVTKKK